MHFSRWAVTDPSFTPQAGTSLLIPGFGFDQMVPLFLINCQRGLNSNLSVVEEDLRIIIVNENRELYELDLRSMTFKESVFSPSRSRKSSHEPYRQRRYQLSSNGYRLVAYYINCPQTFDITKPRLGDKQLEARNSNKTRMELRFVELSGSGGQMQKIELEYSEPELPKDHRHDNIALSPDLSMVRAGRNIFDLEASDYPPMSAPNSLLSHLENGDRSSVCFSPCNGYLIAFEPGYTAADFDSVSFGLYKICRISRTIRKLAIDGLEDLVGYVTSAAFHPMLPLLLLTCSACRARDAWKDLGATKVVEVDLREPKRVPVILLQKLVSMDFESYWA